MTKEVLTSLTLLPEEVAIEDLLLTRRAKLRDFFTISSKTAPCISFGSAEFWKSIENHNRCNEREIGKLKDLLHRKKIRDNSSRRNQQRWSRGHKARGQGQGHKKNPRPRTAFPRTDPLEAKDRNARGQGPRTQSASALQKKKRSSQKFFRQSPKKKKKRSSQNSSDLH